jgi:hypothetical protein
MEYPKCGVKEFALANPAPALLETKDAFEMKEYLHTSNDQMGPW